MAEEIKVPEPPDSGVIKEWFTFVADISRKNLAQTIKLEGMVEELSRKIDEFEETISDDILITNGGHQPIKVSKNEQIKQVWRYLKDNGELEKTMRTLLKDCEERHSPTNKMKNWNNKTGIIFTWIYRITVIVAVFYLILRYIHFESIIEKVTPLLK